MNHQHCGCTNHALGGLGDGARPGRGPSKAQLEEQLARDIAGRIQAAVPHPLPSMAWTLSISTGRVPFAAKSPAHQRSGAARTWKFTVNNVYVNAPDSIRADIATYFINVVQRNFKTSREHIKRVEAWTKTWDATPAAVAHFAKKRSYETRRADGLDLNDLYQRLVATHIHGTHFEREADWSVPRLTWGKRAKATTRMQLGLYTRADKTITVHGNLQDPRWPGYVIADTIWHEMMHYWQDASGRGLSHNDEFRRVEKLFSGHAMSNDWMKRNGDFVWGRSEHVT